MNSVKQTEFQINHEQAAVLNKYMFPNNLDGAVCYMIGAIDHAKDDGVGWRVELKNKAKAAGLNICWIDPCDKPTGGITEIGQEKNHIKRLRAEGKYDELTDAMKQIRRQDLRFVDLSDFVVFKLDPSVPTYGSLDEIYTAEDQHKPMYMVVEGGKNNLPFWLWAVVDHNEVFSNLDELVEHLVSVNRSDLSQDKRWVLIRPDISKAVANGAAA
jgi:hypothetical protein